METTLLILTITNLVILLIFIVIYFNTNAKINSNTKQLLNDNLNQNKLSNNESFNNLSNRLELSIRDVLERNANFENKLSKYLQDVTQGLSNDLNRHFTSQNDVLENRLNQISKKVNESLDEGFQKTQKTFTNIVERLSRIDEAQKKIESLSVEIGSLQDVLTDKKTRGAFGEIQLNQILSSIFGERNDTLYQTQYSFKTGSRSDAVLFMPEPLGTVAIDAKFPLESYQRLIDSHPKAHDFNQLRQIFVNDIKVHIDAIANKYIITHETSDQALMFIPAEAIFAYINAYHPDIIAYSQKKRVWLVSPTTLMSTLTTLQTILVNIQRDKYAQEIQHELELLQEEFNRYSDRWTKLSSRLDQVGKEVKDIHTTTKKITRRFDTIANVEKIDEK